MTEPTGRHGARPTGTPRVTAVRVIGVVVLTVPALVGFQAAFGTNRAFVAAGTGLVLGVLIGWGSAIRRLSAITTAALTVVFAALAAGGAALPATTRAGVIPTVATFRAVATGVVSCWRDLVTTPAPSGVVGDLLLVPYLTALLAGLLGVVLGLRARRPGWAVLPAGAALVVSVLVGTAAPVSVLVQGGLFGVLAVEWIAFTATAWTRPALARAAAGVALLVVAAALATQLGPPVTRQLGAERFVLRDRVQPPLDIRAFQSPLNGFRKYVGQEASTPLFTVTGVPKGTRVRLAAMDAYDGTVWNVAGGTDTSATSSGAFRRLGTGGAGVPVSVAVTGLGGVWVPDVAGVRSVQFTGPRAAELADSFRYNTATGTGIVPAGLQKGDGYTFRADVAAPPGSGSLSGRPAAAMVQPQPQDVPQVVTSVATDAAAKSKTAYARAQAIADKLRTTGYFSDGQANQAVSRAGHGAGRLADLFGSQVWIGDAEQYAAAAGLMARQLGLPTRVVMGFTVPASTGTGGAVVTGKQVTAWIEVAFLGSDWVPFDVTPDSSRVPPQQAPAPAPKPNPATQQPPPPLQQPPPPLPATGNDQGSRAGSASGFPAWLATVLTVAAWVSGPLLVAALVIAAIVGVKVRRRRRRRRLGSTDQRVAAGWWELLDAHRDHGAALPRSGTRREIAGAVGRPGTRELAEEADNAVFAGGTVTEDQATSFWSLVDRELADLASTGWRARWRARLSLRSLRRRTTT